MIRYWFFKYILRQSRRAGGILAARNRRLNRMTPKQLAAAVQGGQQFIVGDAADGGE